jgi:hypothetical protein
MLTSNGWSEWFIGSRNFPSFNRDCGAIAPRLQRQFLWILLRIDVRLGQTILEWHWMALRALRATSPKSCQKLIDPLPLDVSQSNQLVMWKWNSISGTINSFHVQFLELCLSWPNYFGVFVRLFFWILLVDHRPFKGWKVLPRIRSH